ncbi:MAG: right-handed parallel beta-helix repeat-containing protein [bacterium]|nr:right-handed parallel beta-helix repeat-containing protein [bacterium]
MFRPFAAVMLLALSCLAAWGAEGRRPIFEAEQTIAVSGSYYLTRNLETALDVSVLAFVGTGQEVVDLDLNGFTVSSSGAGSMPTIAVSNLKSFQIRDGGIAGTGTQDGVDVTDVGLVVIEDIRFENPDFGVELNQVTQFQIRRNVIESPVRFGIVASGTPAATSVGTIEDNLIRDIGPPPSPQVVGGVFVTNDIKGVTVHGNRIVDSTGRGIQVQTVGPAEVTKNLVENVELGIVLVANGCSVTDNVVEGATQEGLSIQSVYRVQASCTIARNVSSGNGSDGLRLWDAGSRVDGNVFNNNGGYGIWFIGDHNGYKNNTIVGNALACILDSGTGNVALGPNLLSGTGCP